MKETGNKKKIIFIYHDDSYEDDERDEQACLKTSCRPKNLARAGSGRTSPSGVVIHTTSLSPTPTFALISTADVEASSGAAATAT